MRHIFNFRIDNVQNYRMTGNKNIYWRSVPSLFVLFLSFFSSLSSAQVFSSKSHLQIEPFKNYTVDQGLSQNYVKTIVEGPYGFMWVGTRDGLNRYDGQGFIHYRNKMLDSTSLPNDIIMNLMVDRDQNLWVSTLNGLAKYNFDENNFDNYYVDKSNSSRRDNEIFMSFDLDPSHLLVASYGRTNVFDKVSGEFTEIMKSEDNVVKLFKSEFTDDVFILTLSALYKMDHELNIHKVFGNDKTVSFNSIVEIEEGKFYITGGSKLFYYDGAELILYSSEERDYGIAKMFLMKNNSGKIEILSDADSKYQFPKSFVRNSFFLPEQLKSAILSVYQSNDNSYWIGTNGYGLFHIPSAQRVINYLGNRNSIRFPGEFVYSILSIDDNLICFTTENGLFSYNVKEDVYEKFAIEPLGSVHQMVYDSDLEKVIIVSNSIFTLDLNTKEIIEITNGLKSGQSIYKLDSVNYLIGRSESEIFMFNKYSNQLTQLEFTNNSGTEIPLSKINCFVQYRGNIWVGLNNGIFEVDLENRAIVNYFRLESSAGLPFIISSVLSLYVDEQGKLWAGTWGNGLMYYDEEEKVWELFNEEVGFPSNVVYSILEDGVGNFHLSTNNGLVIFDPQLKIWEKLGIKDGLQSLEFNTNSYYKSKNGILYFGGVRGMNFYHPDSIGVSDIPLRSQLLKFYKDHVEVKAGSDRVLKESILTLDTLFLHYNETKIGFDITGFNYSNSRDVQFAYKLIGVENEWVNLGSRRYINFTQLPYGTLELIVGAAVDGDFDHSDPRKLIIVVTPPFYLSFWFISISVISIVLFLYLIVSARTYSLRARQAKLRKLVVARTLELNAKNETINEQNKELIAIKDNLEIRVEEQTKHLIDINNDLSSKNFRLEQFAYVTAHNLNSPIARVKGILSVMKMEGLVEEESLAKYFEIINNNIFALDDIVSDIGAILNLQDNAVKNFEDIEISEVFDKLLATYKNELKDYEVKVELDANEVSVLYAIRPYVMNIFKNLFSNSIKYRSRDRKPEINIRFIDKGEKVICVFSDNGIGFDMKYANKKIFNLYQRFHPNIEGKGMGLHMVKNQIELMNGKIEVISEVNKGTTFKLTFPKAPKVA